jgi:phosphoribosylaminoimidazole carboxylase (NCAIR synthetase)
VDGVGADATVVVLQAMQPLTTDLGALGDDVVVLTDGPPQRAVRADAPPPSRVVSRPRHQWDGFVAELSDAGPVEVVTNDEFCLAQCAEIRRTAGCARVTPEGLDGYLDKVVMKQRLSDAGVPVPPWAPLEPLPGTISEVVPGGLRFPVVVKPRIGANSRGVQVIPDRSAWRSWVANPTGQAGWQVEEFVQGQMCFVDALVVDGR